MRLGLLGGTFDPIHHGHLKIAQTALQLAGLDSVSFVTSVNPPHKSDRTYANLLDRHAMVGLALAGCPQLIPSSAEYGRSGKSYSVDTLLEFRKKIAPNVKLFFLIGMDAFLELATWKDYGQLFGLCTFLVFPRSGHDESELSIRLPEALKVRRLDSAGSESGFTDAEVLIVPKFDVRISSTEIRMRVQEGRSIHELVPGRVEEYITKTRLYLN